MNLGFGAPATRGHGAAPGSPGEAGPRRSGLSVWKEDRLSDQRYSRDKCDQSSGMRQCATPSTRID